MKRRLYGEDDDDRSLPLWGILFEGTLGGGFNTVNQLLHLALGH